MERVGAAPSLWPVAPSLSGGGGVLRVQAVLAVVGGLWSWCWAVGVVRVPLGLVLVAAVCVVRAGRRSADLGASVWSCGCRRRVWCWAVRLVPGRGNVDHVAINPAAAEVIRDVAERICR